MAIKKALWRMYRDAKMALGGELYQETADRVVLEGKILPWIAEQPQLKRVLFVGCEWYTRGYRRLFNEAGYWTIEIDPSKRRYGAKQHIVDSLANVGSHFAEGELDAIVCNGVFGWGLNDKDEVEKAFEGCRTRLREGGHFVLGWNDVPAHLPFPLEESEALGKFQAATFPPLGKSVYPTDSDLRHTFNFYRK